MLVCVCGCVCIRERERERERVRKGNYFGGEPIRRTEIEVIVGKLKNGKTASKDEVTGEMINGGGNRVVDWIWRLFRVVLCRNTGDCCDRSTVQG